MADKNHATKWVHDRTKWTSGWVMEYPFSVQGKVYFILKSGLFSGALNFLVPVSYYLCKYFYLLLPLSFDLEVVLQCEESVHWRKQFSQTTLLLFRLCIWWARLLHKLVSFETPVSSTKLWFWKEHSFPQCSVRLAGRTDQAARGRTGGGLWHISKYCCSFGLKWERPCWAWHWECPGCPCVSWEDFLRKNSGKNWLHLSC